MRVFAGMDSCCTKRVPLVLVTQDETRSVWVLLPLVYESGSGLNAAHYTGHAKVYRWFDDRLDIKAIQTDISSKYVPPHVNIFYCFLAAWYSPRS